MHKVFYSDSYCSTSYSFDTTRKAKWIADSLRNSPIGEIVIEEPTPLTLETLLETHSVEYVEAVLTGEPWNLASSQGFRWCAGLRDAVLASNGGVVDAVKAALQDGVAGTLSSGLHHARRDAGLGFCTFNGLVIAAKEAIKLGCENVLILDLDAHGGGGTASLISGIVRISHLDLVVDPFDLHDDSIDLSKSSPVDYLTLLDGVLEGCQPDLCIYNAGMDVAETDCGPPGFDTRVIAAREATVFAWAAAKRVPIAYALAGGYTSRDRTREELIAQHRCTLRTAEYFSRTRKDSEACSAT